MPLYGTLESVLEYAPQQLLNYFAIQETPKENEKPESLENLLEEKVQCLSDILSQIKQDIQSRKALSLNVICRIYQHYCYLKSGLFELYLWQLGANRSVETRRFGLEKQLDSLKQEKRQEQVKCWQDIAGLKIEFRNWFEQNCDLVQRVKIILPLKKSQILPKH